MASSVTKGLAFGAALFGASGRDRQPSLRPAAGVGSPRRHSLGKLHARGKRGDWCPFLSGAWPRRFALHGFRRDRLSLGPQRPRFTRISSLLCGAAGYCLGDRHSGPRSPRDVRFAGRGGQRRAAPANIHDRLPLVECQRHPSRPHVRAQSVGACRSLLQPKSQLRPIRHPSSTTHLSRPSLTRVGG